MTMTRNILGIDMPVSAIGMGCWAIGGPFQYIDFQAGWGEVDDNESIRAIHKALDMDVNLFDTADLYGMGHSERILGNALKGRRDKAVIATKFGNQWDDETKTAIGVNADPDYIRAACEASLQRLQTDYIDLYQFHPGDYGPDGADEVVEILEELVKAGKIRTYGWSTDFPDRARVFTEGPNCSAIQAEMNVISDSPEILAICEEFNLAAISRGPLAMGLLTGKYTPDVTLPENDIRGPGSPDWLKYFKNGAANPEWLDKVTAVGDILQSDGRTRAQGALAWLWARSDKTLPIPGFRNVAQVEENCAALEYGPLTSDQMAEIDRILGRVGPTQ
jgi:aryl-alcohol dehydrogenase-like predicted oxidoreductase